MWIQWPGIVTGYQKLFRMVKLGQEKMMPLNTGEGPTITKEWLDELLDEKLPSALESVRQARPVQVGDFVKLVQMDRRLNPVPPRVREVIWVDDVDEETLERFR